MHEIKPFSLKNVMAKKFILVLALISASTAVSANVEPGIGARVTATGGILGQECSTGFLIPTAYCSANGVTNAGATLSSGDITVNAVGAGGASLAIAEGIIQDTLYFQGIIPANGRGKITMTATGSINPVGATQRAYVNEQLWVGGFNVPGLPAMFQQSITMGAAPYYQNNCYQPIPSLLDMTACQFSDIGGTIGLSFDFPLSSIPSTGLEFRADLTCVVGPVGGACNYVDPFTITLPAGVTFTSASGQFLTAPVPVPAAAWLFGSGLLGLIGVARKKT